MFDDKSFEVKSFESKSWLISYFQYYNAPNGIASFVRTNYQLAKRYMTKSPTKSESVQTSVRDNEVGFDRTSVVSGERVGEIQKSTRDEQLNDTREFQTNRDRITSNK